MREYLIGGQYLERVTFLNTNFGSEVTVTYTNSGLVESLELGKVDTLLIENYIILGNTQQAEWLLNLLFTP